MAVDAEEVQELGRRGVAKIRSWLEATTFVELHWNAYENGLKCAAKHLAGIKKFDLVGNFICDARQTIYVECKKYNGPHKQYKAYREFLAIAYSATVKTIEDFGGDAESEFIWVTYNPFNADGWQKLESHEKIVEALGEFPQYLAGREINQDLVRKLAGRIWILVVSEKQGRVTMSYDELMKVFTVLDRKKSTL